MELLDIKLDGSGYDRDYNFQNHALTLVFRDNDREKTVRANLRYYASDGKWDLNPIFYEFSEDEKEVLIGQIIKNNKFRPGPEVTMH
ncbi:MAG: hypothetical protein M0T74_11195 [Desulfitobacterium hafniense]|nr:hypothetical protein [Desulfitobacterium hafniense]